MATIGAVVRNRLSCCAGVATIGAGMLGPLELGMLAGGCLWDIVTVMAGRTTPS